MLDAATQTVVFDNGSYTIKAGVSGRNFPQVTVPTLIGRPRHAALIAVPNIRVVYHGHDAYQRRGILGLRSPIQNSLITNFDDIESLWSYIYKADLQLPPSSQPVLMTDSPTNNSQNRWRMAQVAFEALGVPALNISNTASLALYANSRTSGVVVNLGEDVTHIVPIQNGIPTRDKTRQMDLGGRDVAELLASMTPEPLRVARDILAKTGYVALDYQKEVDAYGAGRSRPPDGVQETYELPDRGVVELSKPPFRAPELLFQPSFRQYGFLGVHHQVHSCITSIDPAFRQELYSNIILSGGCSQISGLPDRLAKEVSLLAEDEHRQCVNVIAPGGKEIATWIGGSILSSVQVFERMLVSKQEWEEYGERIVSEKFIL